MRVYATKKLLSKLPLNASGQLADEPPAATNDEPELGDWHANLVLIQRHQCVVFAHNATRFVLFLPCMTKPDLARLDWHFQDVLMNTLLKAAFPQDLLDKSARLLTPLQFDSSCDRSVLSTMTHRMEELKYTLEYDQAKVTELLPYSTSLYLSDGPCTMKGTWVHPVDALYKLIEGLPVNT